MTAYRPNDTPPPLSRQPPFDPNGKALADMAREARERRHAQHRMHTNSIKSWEQLPEGGDKRVCEALKKLGGPSTDREISTAMGHPLDLNHARPCITRLVGEGILCEVDSVKCATTGCTVRRTWFTSERTGTEQ